MREGDEELAYISFLKYFKLLQHIIKAVPKADKEYYKIMSQTKMKQSIEKSESLKKSLQQR